MHWLLYLNASRCTVRPREEVTMMKWRKAPDELVALFDEVVPAGAGAERRKMFGYPCLFVGGNMALGLHEDRFLVRLGEKDRATLLGVAGARVFEPMPGRVMREYVVLPPSVLSSRKTLAGWIGKAVAYAGSLPEKTAKKNARSSAAKKTKPRAKPAR